MWPCPGPVKAAKQKRTAEMHFWSLVFTTFVAVVFAIFSTQDEDCSINVPHLVGNVWVDSCLSVHTCLCVAVTLWHPI